MSNGASTGGKRFNQLIEQLAGPGVGEGSASRQKC
jgi:hypothetical protein